MRPFRGFALMLVVAGLVLSGCREVEETSSEGYEPSKVETVADGKLPRVTLTEEGAKRIAVQTGPIERTSGHIVVPYAALIYDGQGDTFVYTSPKALSFVRAEVKVDRIEGDRVLLSAGPPPGTQVVTVGASEVYGTELGIEGSH